MRNYWVILTLFLAIFSIAQSNVDKNQQDLYAYFYSRQYDQAKSLIESNFLNSPKTSDKIIGLVNLSDYYTLKHEHEKVVESLEQAKKLANESGELKDLAYLHYGYARYYLSLKQEEQFLNSVNKSIEIFSTLPKEDFMLTQLYYLRLKYKMQNLMDQDIRQDCILANQHALKSGNKILISFTYNNLAYYYNKQYNKTNNKAYVDSASIDYQKAYDYGIQIEENSSRKRTLIVYYLNYNIGNPENEQISLKENLAIYYKALDLIQNDPYLEDLESFLYNNIGSTYNQMGQKDSAEIYLLKSYEIQKDNSNILSVYKLSTLNNLAIFYAHRGQFQKAYEYEKLTRNLIEEENQKQFDDDTKALELFYETEKKTNTIQQLEEKNRSYIRQTLLLIGVFILTIMGGLFMFFWLKSRLKLNRQKTEILEAEKKQAELILELEKKEKEQLKINQELLALRQEHLEKQALATSLHLDEKSKFLEELKQKLSESGVNLDKVLKENQILESEFSDLQNIIEQIHPSFFKKLHSHAITKLTTLDLKYASYIYLNMDNQQIANVLKAETNTVRTTKYRLKQKLGLGKDVDLQLFLQDLISQ
jgi:tetratricopeptide (TPR) repeat protein/DNA-binding CsgD family transcriptional regulator